MTRPSRRIESRFGIGEWFGKSFILLNDADRKALNIRRKTKPDRPACPFRDRAGRLDPCTKESGVCSLRPYTTDATTGKVVVVPGPYGMLRTTCPVRFLEGNTVFQWVGAELLKHQEPLLLSEVPYLDPVDSEADEVFGDVSDLREEVGPDGRPGRSNADDQLRSKGVGSVDFVLVRPDDPSCWCALEFQAVYFSGTKMEADFQDIQHATSDDVAFPRGRRRPDYRSSGPKRLMPQLQVKVPSLRRWGKKVAVVVDKWFWASLGKMKKVEDISNCDIVWFVVEYHESDGRPRLRPFRAFYTTLEAAIEGLTAGQPVSLATFETRLRMKIAEQSQKDTGLRAM